MENVLINVIVRKEITQLVKDIINKQNYRNEIEG